MNKLVILISLGFVFFLNASSPHPVLIEVQNSFGQMPEQENLSFQAWRVNDPDYILDLSSTDCYYPAYGIYLHINCGSFVTWNPGDTLHVEVFDDLAEEWFSQEYVLNGDNIQTFDIGNGGMILGVRLDLPEQIGFRYYDGLTIDLANYLSYMWDDEYIITIDGNDHIDVELDSLLVEMSADGSWFGTDTLEITFDSNSSRTIVTDTLMVEVYPNHAPEFDFPDEGFGFLEDDSLSINLLEYCTDFENDDLDFIITGNQFLSCELAVSELLIQAQENWFGEETITINAEDGQGRIISSEEVLITVISVNDLPQLYLDDLYETDEDLDLILPVNDVIFDVEDDSLFITVENNENIQLVTDDDNLIFIPQSNWFGSETLIISVFDQTDTVTDSVEFIVNPVNDPPVINLPDYHTFAADLPMQLDLGQYIYDVDNSNLILTSLSENLEITFDDYIADFTAVNSWHGSENVVITVSDNVTRLSASDTIRIDVFNLSDTNIGVNDLTIDEGEYFELDINTSMLFEHWSVSSYQFELLYDPYYFHYMGHTLENTLGEGGNVFMDVNEGSWQGTISAEYNHYLPLNGEGSLLKVWFQADCYSQTSLDIQNFYLNDTAIENLTSAVITINDIGNTDHPPRADAGDDFTLNAGETGLLDGSFSFDPDDDIMQSYWEAPPEITIENPDSLSCSFIAPIVSLDSQFICYLTITDENSNSSTDSCFITVLYQNFPPLIELPESWQIDEDNILQEDLEVYISDPNADLLILSCNDPINFDVTIDEFEITLEPAVNWFGSETIQFSVSDSRRRLTASDSILVEVLPINDPPVAVAGEDIQLRDGQDSFLDGSMSFDVDGDELYFSWTSNSNILAITNPNQPSTEFSVGETDISEEVVVFLSVNDQQTRLIDTDSLLVTITDDEIRNLQINYLPQGIVQLSWEQPYAFVPGVYYQVYLNEELWSDTEDVELTLELPDGFYVLQICAVYSDGNSDFTQAELNVTASDVSQIPHITQISSIFPNPFNPQTNISFSLAEKSSVNISIYDIKGRPVTTLINEDLNPGWYNLIWKAENQGSGIYMLRMKAGDLEIHKKISLLK